MTIDLEERALQVARAFIDTKRTMDAEGLGVSHQLDIEIASGRGTLLIPDIEAIVPTLKLIGRTDGPILVAIHMADAFMRVAEAGEEPPERGQFAQEYGRDPRIREVLCITGRSKWGEHILVQCSYRREDDGSLTFEEPEVTDPIGGFVVDSLREGMTP